LSLKSDKALVHLQVFSTVELKI